MAKREDAQDVHVAAATGDVELLRRALESGGAAAASAEDADGYTPLSKAIKGGHDATVAMLIDAGAALHDKKYPGLSALALVAEHGTAAMLAHVLRVEPAKKWRPTERLAAIEAAADYNRPEIMDALPPVPAAKLGEIAARGAMRGHAGALRWFVAHDLPTSSVTEMGGQTATLLHHAALGGQAATTAVLIDAGADLNARDARGRTPLMYAVRREPNVLASQPRAAADLAIGIAEGRSIVTCAPRDPPPADRPDTAFALLLAAGADATLVDVAGLDALAILSAEFPAYVSDDDAGAIGLDAVTAAVQVPAEAARAACDIMLPGDELRAARDVVRAAEQAATRAIVRAFAAALRRAGARGTSKLDQAVVDAVQTKDAVRLRDALAAGGAANAAILIANNHSSTTPLGWAASRGDVESCRVLLDAGADVHDGGLDGPPLVAAGMEVARLLLERGADPHRGKPGDDDYTPIDAARMAGRRDLVALLRSFGGEPAATKPFAPGATFDFTATELLVRADAAQAARAVAASIGGEVIDAVLGRTIDAAARRGFLVVQLNGSAWTSVVPHLGSHVIPDDPWQTLAADVSRTAAGILMCYEKVSGQHVYWMYDGGRVVEHYEQDMDEPQLAPSGTWHSERGRRKPRDMTDGGGVFDRLAREERFCVFISRPGGRPGQPFDVVFAGDRRKIASVAYVRA